MSKEFIENPIIKKYVDNPKCTIILFENPPYTDSSSATKGGTVKGSYIFEEMKKDLPSFMNSNISTARDLANQFIWSGCKYLRQENDSYIVFSPIKYWKTLGIIDKSILGGFLFNRKFFHATESCISCILWDYSNTYNESISLDAYDIVNNEIVFVKSVDIKKAHSTFENLYDRRTFKNDINTSVHTEYSGEESFGRKMDGQPIFNTNILGYLRSAGYTIATMTVYFTSQMLYNARGFYVRKDNYLTKLPLFVAKMFPQDNWYDKDIYATTADGGDAYTHDAQFLKSCLIYTCLSNQNKCLTFDGSDGRHYQNELCFDANTLASSDLTKYTLDKDEQELIDLWNKILGEAKTTKNYNPAYTYGVYQITKELNTFTETGTGKNKKKAYDYPALNGDLETLRTKLKAYYKSHITDKMFKYELLK